MTLGSLFDGIGGWLLAAKHAGVEPLWSSEIEAFPCAVTKHHFPDVVQLGDITKLDGARLWPVDIICAGSPCQDLSVAGKQEGLRGERSGLFRDAIRLVRDMRRASGGRYPRFFVWENVPGAFSSNRGLDFRAVLEEIGEVEIPLPEYGRWSSAGMVDLPRCQIAWRTLDAQYWGVPQRRKRIFLVADFRGRSAGEILFECEGVRGDSSEGRKAGKGTAARTESGIGGTSGDCLTPWDCQAKRIYKDDGVFPCLQSTESNGEKPGGVYVPDKARSLTIKASGSFCIDGRGPDIVAAGFKAGQSMAGSIGYEIEKAATLGAKMSGTEPTVAVYGVGVEQNGKAGTLDASYYKGTGARSGKERTCVAVCVGNGQLAQARLSDKVGALNCMHDQQAVMIQKSVRRLTPTEAERLQGLPDGYTLIDDKTCSDTARYKALGNGMAQPCADYVIRRIKEVTT